MAIFKEAADPSVYRMFLLNHAFLLFVALPELLYIAISWLDLNADFARATDRQQLVNLVHLVG